MALTIEECRVLAHRMDTMDSNMLQDAYSAFTRARAEIRSRDQMELEYMMHSASALLWQRRLDQRCNEESGTTEANDPLID